MGDDALQNISKENIPNLLDVLKKDLPFSALIYSWIINMTEWNTKIKDMKIEILCPNGSWESGTVVALCKGLAADDIVFGAIYSREENSEELLQVMSTSDLLPWEHIAHFTGVLARHEAVLRSVFLAKGFTPSPCFLHYLTAQEASLVPVPESPSDDVHVASLDESHLDVVCETWPHFIESLRPVIRTVLALNRTVGVFVRGSLAAMALRTYHGGVGVLQTLPEHRGRGLATLALAALVRDLGQTGVSPQLRVNADNHVALHVVSKLGFRVVDTSYSISNNRITY